MRVIRSDPMPGYRTCGRPTVADEEYGDAVLPDDCPSYLESQPTMVIREEVQFTFHDDGSDGIAGMDHNAVSRSNVRIVPANDDWSCESCGFEMSSFSLTPKPVYRHVSEQHPDTLRRRSLKQDRQAEQQLSIAERQAAALEQANALKERELAIREAELEAADRRREAGDEDPRDDDEAPPAKRRTRTAA